MEGKSKPFAALGVRVGERNKRQFIVWYQPRWETEILTVILVLTINSTAFSPDVCALKREYYRQTHEALNSIKHKRVRRRKRPLSAGKAGATREENHSLVLGIANSAEGK